MRKLLIGLLAVALILCGALLPLVLPRDCPVNGAACERIEVGMTQVEVYAILGGPPGDYRTQPPGPNACNLDIGPGPCSLAESWKGNDGDLTIYYRVDPDVPPTVLSSVFCKEKPYTPALIELVCWRLEKLKNRWFP